MKIDKTKINETALVSIILIIAAILFFDLYHNIKIAEDALYEQQAKEAEDKAFVEKFTQGITETKETHEDVEMSKFLEAIKKLEAEEPPRITGKETEEEIYNNPYIKHVRTALNGHLDGSNSDAEEVMALGENQQSECGLSRFDKLYYQSKFFLYDASDNDYGGVQAYVVFVDKPDTLFWAWIYRLGGDGEYSLRGFCKAGPPDKNKEEFIHVMKSYIESGKMRFLL